MEMIINKVNALPSTHAPNDVYFLPIPDALSGLTDIMDVYLADGSLGNISRNLLSFGDVDTTIADLIAQDQFFYHVEDMDERDLIHPSEGRNAMALVNNPRQGVRADPSVKKGSAMYKGNKKNGNTTWDKLYETESLDVVFDYEDIINAPTLPNSIYSEIDLMVYQISQLQTNVTNLFSSTEDAQGNIIYNGKALAIPNVFVGDTNW